MTKTTRQHRKEEKLMAQEQKRIQRERTRMTKRYTSDRAKKSEEKYAGVSDEELQRFSSKHRVASVLLGISFAIAFVIELFGLFLSSLYIYSPLMYACTFGPLAWIFVMVSLEESNYFNPEAYELRRRAWKSDFPSSQVAENSNAFLAS